MSERKRNDGFGLPWFKFTPAGWRARTVGLSHDLRSIYLDLICYQWDTGAIPNDDEVINSIVGADAQIIVKRFFKVNTDGELFDPWLESIRTEAIGESAINRARTLPATQARLAKLKADKNKSPSSRTRQGYVTREEREVEKEQSESDALSTSNIASPASLEATPEPLSTYSTSMAGPKMAALMAKYGKDPYGNKIVPFDRVVGASQDKMNRSLKDVQRRANA